MGRIFNWFSWQLERRVMKQRIDSLLSDLHQAMQEVTELRIASHEAQLLLHDAERGAKLAAEEQDTLKTRLKQHESEAAHWRSMATSKQKRIAELEKYAGELLSQNIFGRQANTLTSVTESTEQTREEQIKTLAREIYIHGVEEGYSPLDAYELAKSFYSFFERGCQTEAQQENQNNGPF